MKVTDQIRTRALPVAALVLSLRAMTISLPKMSLRWWTVELLMWGTLAATAAIVYMRITGIERRLENHEARLAAISELVAAEWREYPRAV